MHITRLPIGLLESNCYLVYDTDGGEAVIVDPGMLDPRPLLREIAGRDLHVRYILNTHGHFDHVAGNGLLGLPEAELGIHPADRRLLLAGGGGMQFGITLSPSPEPDLDLVEGVVLTLGGAGLTVLHTPGHTPGCVCLYLPDDATLLTGDTLFAGSVGRTDLPGGDQRELQISLARLLQLPAKTRIYPGHGPATTLDVEKRRNPWLKGLPSSRNETLIK
jgi:hydroxyacylglutathione hydrolase